MSNSIIIDSRENGSIEWIVDDGTSDILTIAPDSDSFKDFVLDTGYTLTLNESGGTQQVFTVGSGITLSSSAKSISIAYDSSLVSEKIWKGQLVSDSKAVGVYLRIFIEIKHS